MQLSTIIRPATIEDVPHIFNFIRELAIYEKLLDSVTATVEGLRETLFGKKPYAEVILACIENVPVGFALFFHNYSTFLGKPGIYLEDLYVKPEARGKRLGYRLLAYIASIAKERKCGRVDWSVLDWNSPAIEFYKSINAKPLDDWTVYRLTDDALDHLASQWKG